MPLERVKQGFKDISMTFQRSPLNNDLIAIKDASAIARSVRNIVFTLPGEKFFQPNFGSMISKSLFENINEVSALTIESEIRNSLENYEPRISLQDVQTFPDYENNAFSVRVVYSIIGIDSPPQQLEFVLQSTR